VEANHEADTKPDQRLTVPCSQNRGKLESVPANLQLQYSKRRRKFLHIVFEEICAGRTVKAHCFAADVFGRPPSLDASTNPIVRTEATKVRSTSTHSSELDEMYRDVGTELPKGRPVPVFSGHSQVGSAPNR
jgi:hypothetical protein